MGVGGSGGGVRLAAVGWEWCRVNPQTKSQIIPNTKMQSFVTISSNKKMRIMTPDEIVFEYTSDSSSCGGDSDSTYTEGESPSSSSESEESDCSSCVSEEEEELPEVKIEESNLPPKKRAYPSCCVFEGPAPVIEVIDLVSTDGESDTVVGVQDDEIPKSSFRFWTEAEDKLLTEAMLTTEDVSEIPGRTVHACKTRWLRLNKPGPILSSGAPWTNQEDMIILNYGADVELPGRSYAAIGKRQTYLSRAVV